MFFAMYLGLINCLRISFGHLVRPVRNSNLIVCLYMLFFKFDSIIAVFIFIFYDFALRKCIIVSTK